MDSETKTLFERALYYTYAALKDMEYKSSNEDIVSFNMDYAKDDENANC